MLDVDWKSISSSGKGLEREREREREREKREKREIERYQSFFLGLHIPPRLISPGFPLAQFFSDWALCIRSHE